MIDIATLNLRDLGISATGYVLPTDTYFLDLKAKAVFSKKSGALSRIFGTRKGQQRWYTFMIKNATRFTHSVSLREDRLLQAAAANHFKEKFAEIDAAALARSGHGWLIGGYRDDGSIGFSQNPHLHTTEASVNTEIERLAKLSPGKRFIKVRIEAIVQAGGVSWT